MVALRDLSMSICPSIRLEASVSFMYMYDVLYYYDLHVFSCENCISLMCSLYTA